MVLTTLGLYDPGAATGRASGANGLAAGAGGHRDAPSIGPVEDPRVQAARRLAEQLLVPQAERVDRDGVPASHLRAIADAGLLGLSGPVDAGGSAAPLPVFREVVEVLAGADCATWFVQAQHHSPLAMLARCQAPVRDRLLEPLCRGRLLAGVAFSHLRAFPRRPVTATPTGEGGWRFDGVAPWYTGWGLSQVFLLAGVTPDGDALFVFTEARQQPGLAAGPPLAMAALSGTSTVRLTLDGLTVPAGDVVARLPVSSWAVQDRHTTVNVNPAVLGLTRAAADRLRELGRTRQEPATVAAADRLAQRLEQVRVDCYRLIDEVEPDQRLTDRLAAKCEAMELMTRTTAALVAAGAGGSMSSTAPAQRLAREALFLLVQAQTAEVRAATLARYGELPAR